ncbi:hypothetical protein GCM10028807_63040 [Spirosoma daeguense]
MQPQQNFWSYFFGLFQGVPPEVGQFVASIIGGAIGLIFFPPSDWKGAISQVFVSWAFSHYFSSDVQRKWATETSIEAIRVGMAFSAWIIVSVVAWILKKIKADPVKGAKILRKLADLFDEFSS